MYNNCDEIFKVTIPAVRIAAAKRLSKSGMGQVAISKALGVVQPAISKYLTGKYSKEIAKAEQVIEKNDLIGPLMTAISQNTDKKTVKSKIDEIASSEKLVKETMAIVSQLSSA